MKKSIFIILFTCSAFTVFSQSRYAGDSPFISGMMGAAKVNLSGSDGQAPTTLAFGGSFGIPIVNNLYLYARTSYTSLSNFQSYYNTAFLTGNLQPGNIEEVNSSYSQLLINGGLLYNFNITEDFALGINGGVTFMVLSQEAKLRTGHVISSIDNENIWGAFGGLIAEKAWEDSDVTTFVEVQYNYAESDAFYRSDVLNAVNYTFGVRYYLSGR